MEKGKFRCHSCKSRPRFFTEEKLKRHRESWHPHAGLKPSEALKFATDKKWQEVVYKHRLNQ